MNIDEVLATLLADAEREAAERLRSPEATYRLQFHAGFTFRDAARIAPYLADLGVSHVYASPYLKARKGSMHGYDIVDHQSLNPEIGSDADYAACVEALDRHNLGQVLDVVPNHMGIAGNENTWWNDVLENGPASPYANFFDISWQGSPRPALRDRVLLPLLGDPYGKVLESQQLQLACEAGVFTVRYYEHRLPVDPSTYVHILSQNLDELESALGAEALPILEYHSILTALRNLPPRTETEPARLTERQREKEMIKRRLAALTESCAEVRDHLTGVVALFNGKLGDPRSFDLLERLLDEQAYRLSSWRVAADEVNYRRFFDINELAALRMELPQVFTATHALIFRLLGEGKVSGLRIDHPDGLFDPRQYLERLQRHYLLELARRAHQARPEFRAIPWGDLEGPLLERIESGPPGRALYVVVEKILGSGETLPADWPVHGTSGYDFLNLLGGLFVETASSKAFTKLYREWIDESASLPNIVYQKKIVILQLSLSSELQMLAAQLDGLAQRNRWSRDFTLNSLRRALREVIACFPVYRSYLAGGAISETDRKFIQSAVRKARQRNPTLSGALFQFVREMLLLQYREAASEEEQAEQQRFAGQFQQVTAPVMAKGLEDTAFYVYNRLLALNEVGGDPDRFGVAPAAVHQALTARQKNWPHAMSASSTHDTKRSEDVRARLHALSEMPQEWRECLARWSEMNQDHRLLVDDEPVPDRNEEYFIYQTLLGAWPIEPCSEEEYAEFVRRIQAYLEKAVHEAKVHTSWINPNADYDAAIRQFAARILDPAANEAFLDDFRAFQRRLSRCGFLNSLSQCLLKITVPGVPDFYQGTELWDFSLVDPDNRRPVDYDRRRRLLGELLERAAEPAGRARLAGDLPASMADGRIKLYVTALALRFRREHPGLFSVGDYLPIEAVGPKAENVFSFVRRHDGRVVLVAVSRLITKLIGSGEELPHGQATWGETVLPLPAGLEGRHWQHLFTGENLSPIEHAGRKALPAARVFEQFPVALLVEPSEESP